jgi:hypothetical protein
MMLTGAIDSESAATPIRRRAEDCLCGDVRVVQPELRRRWHLVSLDETKLDKVGHDSRSLSHAHSCQARQGSEVEVSCGLGKDGKHSTLGARDHCTHGVNEVHDGEPIRYRAKTERVLHK